MSEQKDFFRKIHPEQFSDSKTIQVGKLDQDFFDFYLETLTSKGLEKEFEKFCRRLAEVEICPNLLPQTGPTGGGDSKVDSETYPVSELISERWYYGKGDKGGKERWAFAISAKKDWKPKVKSDVKKIAEVNETVARDYTKVFFMTNQYVSDKKRADTEDSLRKEFNLDVRVLDRTWLLEKVFNSSSNKEIAINSFNLSDSFKDEVKIGSTDYKRKQELDKIEEQIKNPGIKQSGYVPLAKRSLILARQLELPGTHICGLIDRYQRFSEEYGTGIDVADAIYDAAWTIYWWYPDDEAYYEYYKKYESLAIASDNVYLFSNLITLYLNLFSISIRSQLEIEEHSSKIQEKYQQFISDPSKPNTAIEARASYQLIRFFLGDSIDEIVEELIVVLNDSNGHLDLDLYPLNRVIQEFPLLEEAKRYNELFELGISIMSQQEKETTAALMLARRGHFIKEEKPYEALVYFSRTLLSFYNESNKEYLISSVLEMAEIFERTGLLWAARNFYYYDFCLCLNQYMKFGEVYPAMFISANALKFLELRLGQIIYSSEFDFLENLGRHIYPGEISNSEESHANYDYLLAIQILRTPFEVIKQLEKFPFYLKERGFHFASAAIKYELGYYDEDILADLNGDKIAFDDLMGKWKNQPAIEKMNNEPWYGFERPYILKTRVLGCSFEVWISNSVEHGEVEVAATMLATIESFFGTGISKELISLAGIVKIHLNFDSGMDCLIKGDILHNKPNEIEIIYRDYQKESIVEDQEQFANFLTELLGMVTSIMFPYKSEMQKIEKMITEDSALSRSHTFSNSVFYGMEILGKSTFSFETVVEEFDSLPALRTEKSNATKVVEAVETKDDKTPNQIHYSMPPDGLGFENISHENIKTTTTINISLWNKSEWRGVIFLTFMDETRPPVLAPIFTKPICKAIFDEWIENIGKTDDEDIIGIKIIKGIDIKNPFWYRVVIGSTKFPVSKGNEPIIIALPSRLHTMTVDNNANLLRFEKALFKANNYYICPAIMTSSTSQPEIIYELMIKKKKTSVSICDAWEIENDDILGITGILPTDNPIIPEGKQDVPVLKALKRKRER
ncbi:hypothetical protein [Alkalibaculum bacchi]|uniref:hypothetical protein n=1 Tax=Alkalibaculum bacchi TaxID=645887 RepID=UPI0026F21C5D|nr:hypothetical protein [Alkalibaculum bacchi]